MVLGGGDTTGICEYMCGGRYVTILLNAGSVYTPLHPPPPPAPVFTVTDTMAAVTLTQMPPTDFLTQIFATCAVFRYFMHQ